MTLAGFCPWSEGRPTMHAVNVTDKSTPAGHLIKRDRMWHVNSRRSTILAHTWMSHFPFEAQFWKGLREHLAERNIRLLHAVPASVRDVAPDWQIRFPGNLLDVPACLSNQGDALAWLNNAGLDYKELLHLEELWAGGGGSPELDRERIASLGWLTAFWADILERNDPDLVLIWNGFHPVEAILAELCRKDGRPILLIERGPLPGTLFLDSLGLSAESRFVQGRRLTPPKPVWFERFEQFRAAYDPARQTWWGQPHDPLGDMEEWRKKLGIPSGAQVVVFAGQVDEDTQSFRHSPLFDSNLAAFFWWLSHLPSDRPLFVLGKHHPLSRTPQDRYSVLLGARGVWSTEIPLSVALNLADAVAAVNSTTLFEAMLMNIPSLSLGRTLASQWGCFYEVDDLARGEGVVTAWLDQKGWKRRRSAFAHWAAAALARGLWAYDQELARLGLRGTRSLACSLAVKIRRSRERALPSGATGSPFGAWPSLLEMGWENDRLKDKIDRLDQEGKTRIVDALLWRLAESNRPVVLWGAGQGGRLTHDEIIRRGGHVSAFVDSDPGKSGSSISGVPVRLPEDVFSSNTPGDALIGIASIHHEAIAGRLAEAGWLPGKDFVVIAVESFVCQGYKAERS